MNSAAMTTTNKTQKPLPRLQNGIVAPILSLSTKTDGNKTDGTNASQTTT